MEKQFASHFGEYWQYVKDAIDENGWVYSKKVPHLLDAYYERNTGNPIDFEKSYEGEWKGTRWRPKSISKILS